MKLGFKKHYSDAQPSDVYNYGKAEWIVGGRILPNGYLASPEEVYKEGTWLPRAEDLILWLKDIDCIFTITYKGRGFGYKIEVTDSKDNIYKAKSGTLEHVLYKAIIKILQKHGGNPVATQYEVHEIISIEDCD